MKRLRTMPRLISIIDPFFISLDATGTVYSGAGAARSLLDSDPADHSLPKLNSVLEMYAAAARAASSRPRCMVSYDSAVPYQRVIDLMARFHEHGISDIGFIDSMDDERTKRPERKKPKPPTSNSIIPLWSPPPSPPDE